MIKRENIDVDYYNKRKNLVKKIRGEVDHDKRKEILKEEKDCEFKDYKLAKRYHNIANEIYNDFLKAQEKNDFNKEIKDIDTIDNLSSLAKYKSYVDYLVQQNPDSQFLRKWNKDESCYRDDYYVEYLARLKELKGKEDISYELIEKNIIDIRDFAHTPFVEGYSKNREKWRETISGPRESLVKNILDKRWAPVFLASPDSAYSIDKLPKIIFNHKKIFKEMTKEIDSTELDDYDEDLGMSYPDAGIPYEAFGEQSLYVNISAFINCFNGNILGPSKSMSGVVTMKLKYFKKIESFKIDQTKRFNAREFENEHGFKYSESTRIYPDSILKIINNLSIEGKNIDEIQKELDKMEFSFTNDKGEGIVVSPMVLDKSFIRCIYFPDGEVYDNNGDKIEYKDE